MKASVAVPFQYMKLIIFNEYMNGVHSCAQLS